MGGEGVVIVGDIVGAISAWTGSLALLGRTVIVIGASSCWALLGNLREGTSLPLTCADDAATARWFVGRTDAPMA